MGKGSLLGRVNTISRHVAFFFIVFCFYSSQFLFLSIAALPSSITDKPQQAAQYRLRGLGYQGSGRLGLAIKAMQRSVELDPSNAIGKINLGWALHLAHRDSEARVVLEEVSKEHPRDVAALNALGIVYLVTGELNRAVATHTRAIILDKSDEIAHYNLALAYHLLGEYESGIKEGLSAAKLEPNNPHPKLALSLNFWSKGESYKSRLYYNYSISLDDRYRTSSYLSHLREAAFSSSQIDQLRQILKSL